MTYNKAMLVVEQYLYSVYTLLLVVVCSYIFDLTTVGWISLIIVLCSSWYSIFEQSLFYQYLKKINNISKEVESEVLNAQLLIFIIVGLVFFIPLFSIFLPNNIQIINLNVYFYILSGILFEHIRKMQIAHDHALQVFTRSILRLIPFIVITLFFKMGLPISIEILLTILGVSNIALSILYLPKRLCSVCFDVNVIKRDTQLKLLACKYLSASVIVDSIVNITMNIFFTNINGLAWIAVFRIYQSIFGAINPVIQFVFFEYFKTDKQEGAKNTRLLIYFSSITFVILFYAFDYLLEYVFSGRTEFILLFFLVFCLVYFCLIVVNNYQYIVIKETNGVKLFIASSTNLILIAGFFALDKFWPFSNSNNWILLWASLSFIKLIILTSEKYNKTND